ncbi:cobalamin biosynthesis protein [Methylocapsa palsarum]|uniref:Cobalt-precorrin 5A hydrolase n=1 Tax=Methylocapsa palsarum TaxID=1612308 RepID=A0A1I4BZH4_9HYPH|nr:cobalamin biosynthesis protein [Methylocapsa palsarum]SFK73800.1 cobalt-precorrin 5A hydrolase [Methylocapsa palsarum]
MIAIGLGCRKDCSGEAIATLVRRALALASCEDENAALFTHEAKSGERGLADAAQGLGLPLVFLEARVLESASSRVATKSAKVQRIFGLPSIAETAALAGAGPASCLIAPRISAAGASCAIARSAPDAGLGLNRPQEGPR